MNDYLSTIYSPAVSSLHSIEDKLDLKNSLLKRGVKMFLTELSIGRKANQRSLIL